jgi:hypothetical protein
MLKRANIQLLEGMGYEKPVYDMSEEGVEYYYCKSGGNYVEVRVDEGKIEEKRFGGEDWIIVEYR